MWPASGVTAGAGGCLQPRAPQWWQEACAGALCSLGQRDGFGKALAAGAEPRTGFALRAELPAKPEIPPPRPALVVSLCSRGLRAAGRENVGARGWGVWRQVLGAEGSGGARGSAR